MSTALYLVRHGFDDFEIGATSIGQRQVEEAGDFLVSMGLCDQKVMLISSELKRAKITADLLAKKLHIPVLMTRLALVDINHKDTYAFLERVVSVEDPRFDAVVAVSHLPNIDSVIRAYCGAFHRPYPGDATNAAVYRVIPEMQTIERVFTPTRSYF